MMTTFYPTQLVKLGFIVVVIYTQSCKEFSVNSEAIHLLTTYTCQYSQFHYPHILLSGIYITNSRHATIISLSPGYKMLMGSKDSFKESHIHVRKIKTFHLSRTVILYNQVIIVSFFIKAFQVIINSSFPILIFDIISSAICFSKKHYMSSNGKHIVVNTILFVVAFICMEMTRAMFYIVLW